MTLIDRINKLESAPVSTVKLFNELFPLTPLEHLAPELEVEVGELADSDTTRFIFVGGMTIKHSFIRKTGDDRKEEKDEPEV